MRVVIAEDEALLRQGLQLLLESHGFEVVAAVGDADAFVDAVATTRPDVAVTDIRMPPRNADDGVQAALRVRTEHPGVGVVILSQHVQRIYAEALLGTGQAGVGYLLKQRVGDASSFCADLRRVADGSAVLDPEVISVMMSRAARAPGPLRDLTPRQREVLAEVAEGRSNAAIAARLGIGEKAVVEHVSNIYEALGLQPHADEHRRVLAALRYLTAVAAGNR